MSPFAKSLIATLVTLVQIRSNALSTTTLNLRVGWMETSISNPELLGQNASASATGK